MNSTNALAFLFVPRNRTFFYTLFYFSTEEVARMTPPKDRMFKDTV
ncbi:hypothetical protein AM1_E0040 (plasmid) [Acaryochloris marina MBIC11017]|uniref:Uncharacterized protein n=1 Tax=Acaryochloris marina (strain MBIC 11017) TaxID=329726 RepID=A8ZP74_ACAM1|nr:hypothetical protein AM1_E0040 [Acaryochloris marina MBIC11017]